ncbi:MAG: PaaI family thioesterase [Rhodospirillales bacterium]
MTPAQALEHFAKRRQPALDTLGNGELLEADAELGRVKFRFTARPEFCHSGDIVQGGFLTGMVDTAMAHAAIARAHFTMAVPTLELKISFFEPGHPGVLFAEGWVVRWGRSIAFLEGTLTDEYGAVIVKASSTIKLIPMDRRPLSASK